MGAFPMFEIVAKRTENAKHFLMSDGTFQANIYMGAIHYQDDSGTWQNIDSTITDPVAVAIPKQPINRTLHEHGGWAHSQHFTTPYNKADLRLPKNIKSGYSIGFGQDRLTFTPDKASPSLGQINPMNPYEIDYQDVWVDTDITLEAQSGAIKETIVLKSNNSPTTFSFKVSDGVIASDWTSGELKILAPWYEDANGTRKDATIAQRTQGNDVYVDVTVDPTGMSFPIVVDPTVTLNDANDSADAYIYSPNGTSNYGATSSFYMGWYTSTSEYRALVQFDISSIPTGVSVSSANIQLYLVTGNSSSPTGYAKAYRNTASWTESSVTWNTAPPIVDDGNGASPSFSSSSVGQYYNFPVTQTMQQWANGVSNYGVTFEWTATGTSYPNEACFVAKENNNVNTGPNLVVNYTTPPTAPTVTAPNGGQTINTTYNITWTAAQNNDQGSPFGWTTGGGNSSAISLQNTGSAYTSVAQIFTVPSGVSSITGVTLYMNNNAGSSSTVNVDIYAVSGGVPTSKINTQSAVVTMPASAGYKNYTVYFSTPVSVNPGTQYAVVVTTTASSSNVIYVGDLAAQPSSFGSMYVQTQGTSTWSLVGNYMMAELITGSSSSSLTYQIDYSGNNGSTWTTIVSQTAAGATSYNYDFTNTAATSTALIRIRAYDGASYGPYDQSNGVFTIQHDRAPTAPTNLSPSSGALDHMQAITATWMFNDPDTGDSQSKYNIKWSTNNGSTWTEKDGIVSASSSYQWPANTFSDGQTVQWMVQTYDTSGLNSPWSAQAQFLAGTTPGTPTITSPANNATVATANPTIQWSSSGQSDYQLQVQDTNSNVLWDSGDVVSTNVAATISAYNLANSTSYKLALRIKNSQGLWSAWTTNTISVSYTPPAQATTTATPDNANARVTVTIANPAPSGSQPTVDHNDLYRRNSGTISWSRIATGLANNSTYYDYAVASGQSYDYKFTAVGSNGTSSDSTIASGVSVGQLRGLWVHDVTNPSGTILNLKYMSNSNGSNGTTPNGTQLQHKATELQFAGRSLPNVEFGESYSFTLTKGKVVLLDTDGLWWQLEEQIRVNKPTFCFRDGRGKMIFGNITGYSSTDMTGGTQVDLILTQTSYSMTV